MARKPTPTPVEEEEIADDQDDGSVDIIEIEGSLDEIEKPQDIKAGRYLAEITNVEIRQGPKARYYAVTFVIPPEEFPSDQAEALEESNPDGIQIYWNRVMVPRSGSDQRSLFRVKQWMATIGLDTATNRIDPSEWMGQQAMLVVQHGTWQGEKRPEIKRVEKADR
jgi:hypothetical protein